jgi:anthranilate phosphoribosyltransferase
VFKVLIEKMRAGLALEPGEVRAAVEWLTSDEPAVESKADFLAALAEKGETTAEIGAFAEALRSKSIAPPLDTETRAGVILDVCGTGGDRLNTINISTIVALIAASAGVRVAKHGNRAMTSQAGSADVLEELGVRVDAGPEEAAASLRDHGFAFFFAPKFHPAFKNLGAARRLCGARGQRTVFNFLGPLLNPARPTAQLAGVPNPALCEPMARVMRQLGVLRGMVVSGEVERDGAVAFIDELSPLGVNHVAEFYQDRGFMVSTMDGASPPESAGTLADLRGGDRRENAEWARRILDGRETGLRRDAVLLNAGAALFVAGRARSIGEGKDWALDLIRGGKAAAKLEELRAAAAV